MWLQLASDSLLRPRAAAAQVLAVRIAPATLVEAAVAIGCAGLVLGYVGLVLSGGQVDRFSATLLGAPLFGAVVQIGVMACVAMLTYRIGRAFGGHGAFWDAVRVVVWLNAITLLWQVAQIGLLALAPPIAGLVVVATLFWLLWAYASFVAELHGFQSPVTVLGVTVLSLVALVLGAAMLASILGFAPQGAS